ncbi:MAG: ubiquinone/menaquinone biosynthesis C-methylase UbiE [Myxococcota bacterium]
MALIDSKKLAGQGGKVTGIDISPNMLRHAKNKVDQAGISNFTLRNISLEEIDYPNDHFDYSTCSFGIFFLPDVNLGL